MKSSASRPTLRLLMALSLLAALSGCSHLPSWLGGPKEEKPRLAGERLNALALSDSLKPDDAIKNAPITLPVANGNADWPQHTGVFDANNSNLAAKGDFSQEEGVSIGEGNDFEHTLIARPVVGEGKVFAMDAVGYISAHDANDITTVFWKSDGVYEDVDQDNIGGGMAYDKGRLYATSGLGQVAAFDAASGKKLWSAGVGAPFRSAPRVAAGKLFATTIDNQLFAFDANVGNVLWTHRGLSETGGWMNAVSPTVVEDRVLAPYSSGELYVLNLADGAPMWSETISMHKRTQASDVFSGIGGDPVVDGEAVYAVSSDNGFSVLNLGTGQRYWERPIGAINTPWVSGNQAFLLTSDNTVVCFMKFDGRIRWATRLQGFEDEERKLYPITWRGPVLVDSKLAVVNSIGQLAWLSAADGSILREQSVADDIQTAPVIAGGSLFVVSKDATLHSYK